MFSKGRREGKRQQVKRVEKIRGKEKERRKERVGKELMLVVVWNSG